MVQVHVVRHKVMVEGQALRKVAREIGVSRNTVKRYPARSAPVRVETAPRPRPVFAKVQERLRTLLEQSPQWTGGKQRLTATRLHAMLLGEGFDVGITTVKEAVVERAFAIPVFFARRLHDLLKYVDRPRARNLDHCVCVERECDSCSDGAVPEQKHKRPRAQRAESVVVLDRTGGGASRHRVEIESQRAASTTVKTRE